jgi:hypothetical protein
MNMGLCLLALLAASVTMVASASAKTAQLPEWGKCIPKARGEYRDAGCTEAAESAGERAFEWKHSPRNKEVIVSEGGKAVFEDVSGRQIVCGGFNGLWHVPEDGDKNIDQVHLAFTDCRESASGASCQNAAPGEIQTAQLFGFLGYVSGGGSPSPSVGLSLEPYSGRRAKPTSGPFAEFTCPALSPEPVVIGQRTGRAAAGGTAGDSVISTIEPVDTMTNRLTRTYSEVAPGMQSLTKFESEPEDVLESSLEGPKGSFELTALTLVTTCSSKEPIEIRAYVK